MENMHFVPAAMPAWPPATVLDIGGAAGRYACWLAREGYEVHLVDPVPAHIQQSQMASALQPETPIASCTIGDARRLKFDSGRSRMELPMQCYSWGLCIIWWRLRIGFKRWPKHIGF
jgi:hypothetical protein